MKQHQAQTLSQASAQLQIHQAELPRKYPEHNNMRIRESVNVIMRGLYFTHFGVVLLYSVIMLIFKQISRITFNGDFVVIIVYGFMLVWVFLINLLCMIIGSLGAFQAAIWCDRFIVKIILMLFPIFAIFNYVHDYFMYDRAIATFMIYNSLVGLLLIFYEIYSCTYGHHDEPGFLYEANQLGIIQKEINTATKEFEIKKKESLMKKMSNKY